MVRGSWLDERVILHVDLNSFFAMAEQQANPVLRGKPVGVVKARGRSCIIAASVEAKKLGITTGMRTYDARKIYPNIVLISADFAKYEYISRKFIEICANYSPLLEVFSLDECFIDVTESEKFWNNAFNIAFEIKRRLKGEVGDYLTCSIGISHNKYLAKLASEQIKPDGLFWITKDNALEVLDRSNLTDVCGLGIGLWRHLMSLGVDTFPKLRACQIEFLCKHFGPFWSVHLYNMARGIDETPVVPIEKIPQAKSVGRTYTTHGLMTKRSDIFKVVRNLSEEAAFKARRMGLAGRFISFSLREGRRGRNFYGHITLKTRINDGKRLFDVCRVISAKWDFKEMIFCGVTLGMLEASKYQTMPIFPKELARNDLTRSVDAVNEKYGEYTLFPAQLLGMPIVMPEVTGYFGDRKYQLGKAFN